MENVEEAVGYFSISCKFKNVGDQFEWTFKCREMWEELAGLISWWNLLWCLGGNFNVIRFPSERLRAISYTQSMYEFSDFISLHGLMDILMEAGL